MGPRAFWLTLVALLLAVAMGSALAAQHGLGTADQCNPGSYQPRCLDASSMRACVRVDRSDYLLGVASPHHELTTVTCPGATPLCLEARGRAVCRAK